MFNQEFSVEFDYKSFERELRSKQVNYNKYVLLKAFKEGTKDDWNKARREYRACVPSKHKSYGYMAYDRSNKKSIKNHFDGRRYINSTSKEKIVGKKGGSEGYAMPPMSVNFAFYGHTRHYHLLSKGHRQVGHKPDKKVLGYVSPQEWTARAEQVAKSFKEKVTSSAYANDVLRGQLLKGYYGTTKGTSGDLINQYDDVNMLREESIERHLTEKPNDLLSGKADVEGNWKLGKLYDYDSCIKNVLCRRDADGYALYPSYRNWATLKVMGTQVSQHTGKFVLSAICVTQSIERKMLNYRGAIDYHRGPQQDPSKIWSRSKADIVAWRMRLRQTKWEEHFTDPYVKVKDSQYMGRRTYANGTKTFNWARQTKAGRWKVVSSRNFK